MRATEMRQKLKEARDRYSQEADIGLHPLFEVLEAIVADRERNERQADREVQQMEARIACSR